MDLSTGSSSATLDRGTSNSLTGLTDTRIRVSYIVGEELALITAGVSTPTGKTVLDTLEQEVSNYLAQDALGFRTPVFGQGLEINVGLATAHRIGETVFGLGAGYLRKSAYTPGVGEDDYTPGDEVSFTLGFDRPVLDGNGKITFDAVYTAYAEDEQGGQSVFQSGNKLLLQGLGHFRTGGLRWQMRLVERYSLDSTSFEDEESGEEFSNGNQFEAGLSGLAGSGRLVVGVGADIRLYADNEFEQGEALVWGVGPELRVRLGRSVFSLSARYMSGEIDAADVNGIDVSGGLWFGL